MYAHAQVDSKVSNIVEVEDHIHILYIPPTHTHAHTPAHTQSRHPGAGRGLEPPPAASHPRELPPGQRPIRRSIFFPLPINVCTLMMFLVLLARAPEVMIHFQLIPPPSSGDCRTRSPQATLTSKIQMGGEIIQIQM